MKFMANIMARHMLKNAVPPWMIFLTTASVNAFLVVTAGTTT
jgi:ABC-type dipeptide/oligopeptide/nickel transport system permease subunit